MIFHSDKFMFDNIHSDEMGIMLVDTKDKGVLMDYGVTFKEEIKTEHTFGDNPFYTHKNETPEKIIMEFCLIDDGINALSWDSDIEEKIVNWLMKDKFCEFVTYDYPELVYYLRGVKASKKRNHEKKGILEIEFQPYYKHPIRKIRKNILVNGKKETLFTNDSYVKDYVYPVIEIVPTTEGDVKITNLSINEEYSLVVKDLKKGQTIRIDNEMYVVTDDKDINNFHKVNRKWFKLKQGENRILLEGNARFKINCNLEVRI